MLVNLRQAWQLAQVALRANKGRSFLTMLGIIIGIAAVVVIMSVGAGAQSLILGQVKSLGSNLIGVLPGASDEKGPPAQAFGIIVTTLTEEDIKAATRRIPEVVAATGYARGFGQVSWQNQSMDTSFVGVSYGYPRVEAAVVERGRFFDEEEVNAGARLAILGSEVADELFGGQDPLGQTIKIKREIFQVIGVFKERGSAAFENVDSQVVIPLVTAQKVLLGINHLSFARLKVDQAEGVAPAIEQVKEILRERHNIEHPEDDDFSVRNQADALESLTAITNGLKFFLAAVAAISLLVGGIGIMNIMLVAVSERTREIGLRKAVGARRKNILAQFLLETLSLTFFGAFIGLVSGALISILIALVAQSLGYEWALTIPLSAVFLSVSVAVAIGLLFGVYPAKQAAGLDPIEALRYE